VQNSEGGNTRRVHAGETNRANHRGRNEAAGERGGAEGAQARLRAKSVSTVEGMGSPSAPQLRGASQLRARRVRLCPPGRSLWEEARERRRMRR